MINHINLSYKEGKMQEDRTSLLPGRMTWSHSVRPKARRSLYLTVRWDDVLGCFLAIANFIFYNHLAMQMFDGFVVYFVCIVISTIFVGFVYQMLAPTKEIMKFLGIGTFFIIGMMMYQTFLV
ncbi:MAG: hypothetical protein P1P90_04880 [Patescibacteria group bacterium]|nr:hypothetical protein [Patescibacteria group bacterium]